jgi:RimJ/RimL family protein N-acetyltransferase
MVVGQVGATSELNEHGAIEIGYGFGVPGHGYATEAVGAVVADLLSRPSVRVVTANTATGNIASARVLEKNDFVRTGTARSEDDGDLITGERR